MTYKYWNLSKEDGVLVLYANNMKKPQRTDWLPAPLYDNAYNADTDQFHRTKQKFKVDPRYYTGIYKLAFPFPISPSEKHIYDSQLTEGMPVDPSKLIISGEYVMLNSEPTDVVAETPQTVQEPIKQVIQQEKTQSIPMPQVKPVDINKKLCYKKFESPEELVNFVNEEKIQKSDIQRFGLEIYYWKE